MLLLQLGDYGLARRVDCDPHTTLPPLFPVETAAAASGAPPPPLPVGPIFTRTREVVTRGYRYVYYVRAEVYDCLSTTCDITAARLSSRCTSMASMTLALTSGRLAVCLVSY